METILAHFDGKNIVPDQPLSLPAGQTLRIVIESVSPSSFPGLPPELEEQEKGMIVVRGTRIPLYLVLEALFQGKTSAEIQAEYPSIPVATIRPIQRFVEQNDAAMRNHYESEKAELDRLYAEGKKAPSLESLRARMSSSAPGMNLKFLLDEQLCSHALWYAIENSAARDAPLNVLRVGENGAPPNGTADPQLLAAAAKMGRILISRDKKTMPRHFAEFLAAGNSSPGLIMVREARNLPKLVEWLAAIAQECSASEFTDIVSWIP